MVSASIEPVFVCPRQRAYGDGGIGQCSRRSAPCKARIAQIVETDQRVSVDCFVAHDECSVADEIRDDLRISENESIGKSLFVCAAGRERNSTKPATSRTRRGAGLKTWAVRAFIKMDPSGCHAELASGESAELT